MKIFLATLTCLCFFILQSVNAQTSNISDEFEESTITPYTNSEINNENKSDNIKATPIKKNIKGTYNKSINRLEGLALSVYYSYVDSAPSKGSLLGTLISGSFKTSPSFGVSGEYRLLKEKNIGVSGGLSSDFSSQISELNFTGDGYNVRAVYNPKLELGIFTTFVNLTYMFNNFYGVIGPNYPVSITLKNSVDSLVGQIGYQVGIGYIFNKNLSVEFNYRTLNARLTAALYWLDTSLGGVLLKVNYQF